MVPYTINLWVLLEQRRSEVQVLHEQFIHIGCRTRNIHWCMKVTAITCLPSREDVVHKHLSSVVPDCIELGIYAQHPRSEFECLLTEIITLLLLRTNQCQNIQCIQDALTRLRISSVRARYSFSLVCSRCLLAAKASRLYRTCFTPCYTSNE